MFGLLGKRVFVVIVVGVLVFLGINYVPIYFNAWQFYDASRQVVRFAGMGQQTVDDVRDEILDLAEEWAVPVHEDDVKVQVTVTREGPVFTVQIYYEVPVDLRVTQDLRTFDWEFTGETFAE
jgi:hypothetical protein